jgi:DNA-binding MarR family transcriptional regulator
MERPLVHLLMHIGRLTGRQVEEELSDTGLHHAQARVLAVIGRCGAVTQANLARGLDVKPASITTVLKPLERRGLVRRETDPLTNRAIVVRLTPAGDDLCRRVAAAWARVEASLRAGLREHDFGSTRALLERIRYALGGRAPEFVPYCGAQPKAAGASAPRKG